MEYKVTHKGGKEEILERHELPRFSNNFNRMVKDLRIGEKMYDIDSMTEIERIK